MSKCYARPIFKSKCYAVAKMLGLHCVDGGCRTLRVFVADIGGVASLGPRLLRPVVAAFAMTLLRHYLRAVIAPLPQSPTNR